MQQKNPPFQASSLKRILYGLFTLLGILLNILVIYLFLSGQVLPEALFSTSIQGLIILGLTLTMWGFFIRSLEQITIEGSVITVRSGLFRKKIHSLDLLTISRIEAVKAARAGRSLSSRADSLTLSSTAGESININLVSLSRKDRQQVLQLLAPTLLKAELLQAADKSQVQWLLAAWNIKNPLRITDNADEIIRKVKKTHKLTMLLVWIALLPLILLVLLIALGSWYQNVSCRNLLQNGKEATAHIQSVKADRTRQNPDKVVGVDVTASYNVEGKSYEKTIRVSYDSDEANQAYYDQIKNTSSVQIRYLQEQPRTSDLASNFTNNESSCR